MRLIVFCLMIIFPLIAEAQIPRTAWQYQAELIRVSRQVWGMQAPIAIFAAQIHTESRWNNDVVSHAGAQGLAQFMPSTAAWLPKVHPETGTPLPFNPTWALRALVTYDLYLWQRITLPKTSQIPISTLTDFNRMAFTLSAYNGGLAWVQRDQRLAYEQGLNPAQWFEQVSQVNAGRKASSVRENREYVRLILLVRQQWYSDWGPGLPVLGSKL